MVTDIVKGTFKGFALLRQITNPGGARAGPLGNPMAQPRPVYAQGYGLIPPSQVSKAARAGSARATPYNGFVLSWGLKASVYGCFVQLTGIHRTSLCFGAIPVPF